MGKHCRLLVGWLVNSFFLRVRRSVVPLLCGVMLLFNADCALTMGDLEYSAPKAEVVYICDKPLDVPPEINLWAYDTVTGRIVTGEDPAELRYFAGMAADMLFEYDPDAPASSAKKMPERFGLTCRKPEPILPDSTAVFPVEQACPLKVAATVDQPDRPDPRFLAAVPGSKPGKAQKKDPKRVHVCARPSWVKEGVNEWAMIGDLKASRLTANAKEFAEQAANAETIFILDDNAPPESVYWFVDDPAKLRCPNKPAPRPYEYVARCGMLEMNAAADALADAARGGTTSGNGKTASSSGGQGTGKTAATKPNGKGDGQTTDTSSPNGKGPPLNFVESLARNLQYPGAIARGDTSGRADDPDGARHGMLGGKNKDATDLLVLQIAVGVFSIIQNPFTSVKDFVKKINQGLATRKTPTILDPKVLTEELAEKLAKEPEQEAVEDTIKAIKEGKEIDDWPIDSFGKAMGPSLAEAGVIMPYSRAKIFTRGWEGKFQAHHLLEAQMAKDTMKMDARSIDDIPAIVLSEAEHKAVTRRLNEARAEFLPGVKPEDMKPHDLWKVYQEAYQGYPAWLDAIEGYFKK